MKTEITDFKITPGKKAVLYAVGCYEGSGIYDTVSRYFDEIKPEAAKAIRLYASAKCEDGRIYCCVSAGENISEYTRSLFDKGDAMKGLLVDAYADECLFEADKVLSEEIKLMCAKQGKGIKSRLSAPDDFPLAEQKTVIEKSGASCVTVTDAFMLSPVKSMAYVLELTDDENIFNAQHDCSKCKSVDCPRRSAPYSGDIVSAYEYVPPKCAANAVCIDIGTTTIAMEYISHGEVKKTYKTINPQRRFGADVLSRIDAANRGRLTELSSLVRFALGKGIAEITDGETPEKVIIAANTTMVHLFMSYPCVTLGEYPFKSEYLATSEQVLNGIPTFITGGISAFVGGDIVSGLYMCGFDNSEKINLFIDLGTNGEMAIGNKDRIIATSTAAGPAFEGGRLSFSSSGSDVIDIMARLLRENVMDNTGKLANKYFDRGYKINENITVSQQDIREIQTAKAAIRAGIECLTDAYGVKSGNIDTVYLAGGMGYRLSPENAAAIGLLPKELADKAHAVGNGSLGGCVKLACEGGAEGVEHIRAVSREFSLASHKDFDGLYIKHMSFE